jgi:SAM-dependent methyltransferase
MPAAPGRQRIMIAPTTAEETLLPREDQQETLLPKQLVDFANEAFVFADVSRIPHAPKATPQPERFPALPQAYFADVAPPPLTDLHLRNTRVVSSREQILSLLPKGGICVEIDTKSGSFGQQILDVLEPAKLHLCDLDFNFFDDLPFTAAMEQGIVELHEGEAAEHLAALPDRHFDLIHLQADHSYATVARTLEQAGRKIKEDGFILCANYMTFSPLEGIKCGVARAVNEFCHRNGFEIFCLALNSMGYHDAALRKCAGPAGVGHLGGAFLEVPDTATYLPDVWAYLIEKYQIHSVLDVGAGAGWTTKWFADQGIYTLGVEGWREALEKSQCRANIVEHDYSAAPFIPSMLLDLAWCAGFVEQIEEEFIPNFMASFRSCRHVCLTHAEPGEPGYHHVNCQPTEYWIRKMNEFGFDYDAAESAYLRSTDKHKMPRGRKTLSFFKRRD